MFLLWGAVLTFSPSECCFRTRELLQQQAAARDVAAATAFQWWALIFFACSTVHWIDTGTNIYLFMLLNFDDRAKAWLATLSLAHARAIKPALVNPLAARYCDKPPVARLFHL